jgi:hypothetical protein
MKKLSLIIVLILCLQTPAYAADTRSYVIIGEEHRPTDVYVCDSYYIFVPDNLNTEKQLITKDMLKKEFEKVPLKLRSGIQYLVLLDFKSAWELKLKEIYGKDFAVFSEYYNNNIFFYQNDTFKTNLIAEIDDNGIFRIYVVTLKKYLEKYVYHESAHHYDSINKISESKEWQDICDKDKIKLHPKDISNYAEEFAASVEKYYLDLDYLKKYCPERYDFISKIFEQKK